MILRSVALALAIAACRDDGRAGGDAGARPDAPAADAVVSDVGVPDVAPDAFAFAYPAVVAGHVDGDTIDVEFLGVKTRVRLVGVDTPEVDPPEPFALEASAFTRDATPVGSTVGLEFDDARCALPAAPDSCYDIYGRLLAYIRLSDGRDLGAELILRGLADVYESADFDRRPEYEALQAQAMKDGVGIWS